jgi:tetratricopeptide (TPR) repeat protein/tRNA A-37 threonylcarbamoyl transferase component Bud32
VPAPPSDPPTRTAPPADDPSDPATHTLLPTPDKSSEPRTLSVAAPAEPPSHHTRPFDGPDSPTDFAVAEDRYVLGAFIARGGMGEVFTARDRVLNREVAVKLLRDDCKDRPGVASRFVEEARITGKLAHPGIPPIHDLGTFRDGRPFIAMKLIKGRTLSDWLARERPDRAELLRVFEEVCQAVAAAHERRVIHRDLKPGNVMVGAFGEVQVMDWGLAKALGDAPAPPSDRPPADTATVAPVSVIESDRDPSSHTRAGSLLGTPAYMPPEQAKGEVDRTDTRSDVFALGGMLCELLTGKPPYSADTSAEVQALALTAQLGPAFERLAGCDADSELIDLARRCLSADPDARPVDAGEVAKAVAAYRTGVEDRLRTAERDRAAAEAKAAEEVNTRREAEARAAERRARRRVQYALVAAGVVLLLGGGAVAWWADKEATDRRTEKARLEREKEVEAERHDRDQKARESRNAEAVEALLKQCEDALTADDPDRADLPLVQIDRRLGDGGADHLSARIRRCRADLAMLRALDRADDAYWGADDWKARYRAATAAWAAAFKDYGIVPGVTPDAAAVEAVNSSLTYDRLLIALDLWHMYLVAVPADDADAKVRIKHERAAIRKLLDALDPDPYRAEVRELIERGGDKALTEAVAADPRALRQPPRFAVILGRLPNVPLADRERIFRPAVEQRPGLLPLLLTLANLYENTPELRADTLAQQLRWAQAAVSVRPTSKAAWRCLAKAFWDRGSLADAVRCYKRALRLDPEDVNTLTSLTAVLLRMHDPEAAEEYARRALAVAPNYSIAHSNLGSVLDRRGEHDRAREEYQKAVDLDAANGSLNAIHLNNLGYAWLRAGNPTRAIAYFREALRIKSDFPLAEANLNYARRLKDGPEERELSPPPRAVDR